MDWDGIVGFGVAGNMAGHLEQAGEDRDFVAVSVSDRKAPKGMFPFYLPHPTADHQLHVMPLCDSIIEIKPDGENYQIEPEVSLLCSIEYQDGIVTSIVPHYAMAHNDCSIRKEGAKKISEKKNWGARTKGVSSQRIAIDSFAAGGALDHYQLTSYLLRGDVLHHYGVSSPLTSYSYFYEELLDWMVDRFAHQQDVGPLENLQEHLANSSYPKQALISIGATRYTDFGASNFLQPGDFAIVAVYDRRTYTEERVRELIRQGNCEGSGISILKQRVLIQADS